MRRRAEWIVENVSKEIRHQENISEIQLENKKVSHTIMQGIESKMHACMKTQYVIVTAVA